MTIERFFEENKRTALAFSGGVDSAYLLYAGLNCGADIQPYFIKTSFQPEFELDDAQRMTGFLGVELKIISVDLMNDTDIIENSAERCYHCKTRLFQSLLGAAQKDGYELLLDGNNASDDTADRPGMRAVVELGVRSPLRECGLTKSVIRALSKEAGLFTWDKPAYACLATRIPTGVKIIEEDLVKIERAENYLFSLGFTDFRVRFQHGCARIQLKENQMDRVIAQKVEILKNLSYFNGVMLDLQPR